MSGFYLYQSNTLERLAARFCDMVRSAPPSVPFKKEFVVVQTAGMQRWLSLQAAYRNTVFAGFAYCGPHEFFDRLWFVLHRPDTGYRRSPYRNDVMKWALYAVCRTEMDTHEELGPLRRYAGDDEVKLFQVCSRIADLYDQYMMYRPDMIRQWEQGGCLQPDDNDERWQMQLWRLMKRHFATGPAAAAHMPDRVEMKDTLLRTIAATPAAELSRYMDRVSLFGLSSLPPYFMDVFRALAERIDVHLYLMNPCRQEWSQLPGEQWAYREQMRAFDKGIDPAQLYLDTGNPLLSRLGVVGRDFNRIILDTLEAYDPQELYEEPDTATLLGCIQHDILHLHDRTAGDEPKGRYDPADPSLRIVSCHAPMREVEVLHDHILAMFDTMEALSPDDILVVTPDIDAYAPYIDVVFSRAAHTTHPEYPFIPYCIADRSMATDNSVAGVLRRICTIPFGRMEVSEVLPIFESDAVKQALGLDTGAIELVRQWVRETGIRWGIDAAHRGTMGFPPYEEASWDHGVQRLMAGYAMDAGQGEFFSSVLPYENVTQQDRTVMGAFVKVFELLRAFVGATDARRTVDAWAGVMEELIRSLFDVTAGTEDERQGVHEVLEVVRTMREQADTAGVHTPLSYRVFARALMARLRGWSEARGFLAGGITFSSMVPMRSIPFRVICMLGMNDEAFPRTPQGHDFDLMQRAYRPGDRNTRYNDLYLFLELLLSARQRLYISYCGKSERDNSDRLAADPVIAVRQYCDQGFVPDGDDGTARTGDYICVQHPLQPFDRAYLHPRTPALFTYSSRYFSSAHHDGDPAAERFAQPFSDVYVRRHRSPRLTHDAFVTAFVRPARFFCSDIVGMRLPAGGYEDVEDTEMFTLGTLEAYTVKQDLLAMLMRGGSPDDAFAVLHAQGRLPYGTRRDVEYNSLVGKVYPVYTRITELVHGRTPYRTRLCVTTSAGDIEGYIHGLYRDGTGTQLLRWRPATCKPRDRVRTWLYHVLLNAAQPGVDTTFVGEDGALVYRGFETAATATGILQRLCRVFERQLQAPVPFFPELSLRFVEQTWEGAARRKDTDTVIAELQRLFYHGAYAREPAICRDEYVYFIYRSMDPFDAPLREWFEEAAYTVCEPLLRHETGA
jgi:exodeoxyribonuclease V gamma subunit